MKKVFLIIVCLFMIVGCKDTKKDLETNEDKETKFELKKLDESKDYVYLIDNRTFKLDNKDYLIQTLNINLNSDDVSNINLEIKTFVNNSIKNAVLDNNNLKQGNVISYKYYVTKDYISVIQNYYFYVNGIKGEDKSNVYVISLIDGKRLSNNKLLEIYSLDEDKLYEMLESIIDSEDVLYTISNIKNHGYDLYVNNDNKLCMIYDEVTDEYSEKKELILK